MARQEPFLDHDDDHEGRDVYRRRSTRPTMSEAGPVEGEEAWDAPSWGLMDRILAAPGHLAMTVVAIAAFGIVAVNAAYRQPGAHPAPMLATRAEAPAQPLRDTGPGASGPGTSGSGASIAELQNRIAATPAPNLPSPNVPPQNLLGRQAGAGDTTASIGGESGVRAPYTAPAPLPRPASLAVARSATPTAPQSTALPAPLTQPAPVPVATIAVNDPIGALLAPVIASRRDNAAPQPLPGQPVQAPVATRSAQPMVVAVQTVLAELGYQPGSIDGVIGPSTEEAIRRFQLRRALEPNGQITNELLREIERVTGQRIAPS